MDDLVECVIPSGFFFSDKPFKIKYCPEHARKEGYCPGCGLYYGVDEYFCFQSKTGMCKDCEDYLKCEIDPNVSFDGPDDFDLDLLQHLF